MGALSGIKNGLRRAIATRPAVNRAGRPLARLLTAANVERRKHYPIVGTFPVRLPWGDKLTLLTRREDWLLTALYWYGFDEGESAELTVFRTLARQSKTILDIGANIGVFGLAVAADNPQAQVHAFEPLPDNSAILKDLIAINGLKNLTAHDVALSDQAGEAKFYVPRNRLCNVRDGSLVAGFRDDVDEVPVKLVTLDQFAADKGLTKIDLMKIDVESAEVLVLSGARGVLRRDRPAMICEVLSGGEGGPLEKLMSDFDYRYFWVGPGGLYENEHLEGDPQEKYRMQLMLPEEKALDLLWTLEKVGFKAMPRGARGVATTEAPRAAVA
ncbi:MAG TPA: FkbM family methyltransferase [Tepidisphaeraceae bacterium]|nr:FkbM family methyltransferase [Tepidisphaeraceae bacterium]